MNELPGLGKILTFTGILLVIAGLIVGMGSKIPGFGKLPGDIYIKRDGFSLYFPLTTCLIVSAVISMIILLIKALK